MKRPSGRVAGVRQGGEEGKAAAATVGASKDARQSGRRATAPARAIPAAGRLGPEPDRTHFSVAGRVLVVPGRR